MKRLTIFSRLPWALRLVRTAINRNWKRTENCSSEAISVALNWHLKQSMTCIQRFNRRTCFSNRIPPAVVVMELKRRHRRRSPGSSNCKFVGFLYDYQNSKLMCRHLLHRRNDIKSTSKNYMPPQMDNNSVSNAAEVNKPHHIRSNKENSKPADIYIKKPRTCTLLDVSNARWHLSVVAAFIASVSKFPFVAGLQTKLESGHQSFSTLFGCETSWRTSSIRYGFGQSSECIANR